jgi:hypothetical protein
MSQRYVGRPLAGRDDGSLLGLVCGVVAILAGPTVTSAIVQRYERRLGRRYHRTVGEPEKVVWLTASGPD